MQMSFFSSKALAWLGAEQSPQRFQCAPVGIQIPGLLNYCGPGTSWLLTPNCVHIQKQTHNLPIIPDLWLITLCVRVCV